MADGQEKSSSNLQEVAGTVKSGIAAVKAAGKAAAGNVPGAVLDVLKDEKLRNAIIAVILVISLLFSGVMLALGSIVAIIVDTIVQCWNENWESVAVESGGSTLYLYTIGVLDAGIGAVDDTFNTLLDKAFSAFGSHEVNGQDASNDSLGGTDITKEDYVGAMQAVTNQDEAKKQIRKRIDLIKERVAQRGQQIKDQATVEGYWEAVGTVLDQSLSALVSDPITFAGIDIGNSSVTLDTSAFELTDLQALKILALYCAQHSCGLADADMWGLMDYCGWYELSGFVDPSELPLSNAGAIYDTTSSASTYQDIAGIRAGSSIALTQPLPSPTIASWTGTCMEQWVYEENAQIQEYNREHSTNYTFLNFEKIRGYKAFSLIDSLYTSTNASVTIKKMEYTGFTSWARDFLLGIREGVDSISEAIFDPELVGPIIDYIVEQTVGEIPVAFSDSGYAMVIEENGKYFVVLTPFTDANAPTEEQDHALSSVTCMYLQATDASGRSEKYPLTGKPIVVADYVQPGMTYDIFCEEPMSIARKPVRPEIIPEIIPQKPTEATTPTAPTDATEPEVPTEPSEPEESTEPTFPEYRTIRLDSITIPMPQSDEEKNKTYTLAVDVEYSFAARSIDELADLLGLWPNELTDVVEASNGMQYANGHFGDSKYLLEWTDKRIDYVDSGAISATPVTFHRNTPYQVQFYRDQIKYLANLLEIDTTGAFQPEDKPGQTMVDIARQEYAYYTANNLLGGQRYWSAIAALSDSEPMWNAKWDGAFVLTCAAKAGYISPGGCFGDFGGGNWVYTPDQVLNAITRYGDAEVYTEKDYAPQPGDLIILDAIDGTSYIGIVDRYNYDNGCVDYFSISDTVNGRTTLERRQITWDEHITSELISLVRCFLHLNAPAGFPADSAAAYAGGPYAVAPGAGIRNGISSDTKFLMAGIPGFRKTHLREVTAAIQDRYPDYNGAEMYAAINRSDSDAFIKIWNETLESDSDGFKQAQMQIAADLIVSPIAESARPTFDWEYTPARRQLLWAICSTSDNSAELITLLSDIGIALMDRPTPEKIVSDFLDGNLDLGEVPSKEEILASFLAGELDSLHGPWDTLREKLEEAMLDTPSDKAILSAFLDGSLDPVLTSHSAMWGGTDQAEAYISLIKNAAKALTSTFLQLT